MKRITIALLVLALAVPAYASTRKNFKVDTKLTDFVDVFKSQMELLGVPSLTMAEDYCIENDRKACRYILGDGVSIVVSADAEDGVIDLFNLLYRPSANAPANGDRILVAIMRMAQPDLDWSRIQAPLQKVVQSVLIDKTSISETVETDQVVFRFVFSPIQGPIFTATPK